MEVNIKLAAVAKRKGICAEWHKRLLDTDDKGRLVEMYLRGIDFCLKNEYPSNDFIRKHFVGVCEQYGVFLDEPIDVRNYRNVVALGTSSGIARYTDYEVGQVFLKHGSRLTVNASGNSFVMIDLFDRAELTVRASDNAKVCVHIYGGTTHVEQSGMAVVKTIKKNKSTY